LGQLDGTGGYQVVVLKRRPRASTSIARLQSARFARAASLIHLAGSVRGARGEEVLPAAAVESAITVGDYAIEHAKAVFSLMGADPQVELARRVLRWIANAKLTEFSRHDAFYHLRGSQLPRVTDLDPALTLLVAHGYVAPVAASRGPGRPSQKFRVNPLAQNPQNPQKGAETGVLWVLGFCA
jgi:replicative DNA helicase